MCCCERSQSMFMKQRALKEYRFAYLKDLKKDVEDIQAVNTRKKVITQEAANDK